MLNGYDHIFSILSKAHKAHMLDVQPMTLIGITEF